MPGRLIPGNAGHVAHAPAIYCTPGVQKATYRWGVWCFSGTSISQREPASLAGISGASYAHPLETLCGGLPASSGPHMACPTIGATPTSITIKANCLVGEDPGNLLAFSSLLNCSTHLANSSCYGWCLSEGVPTWVNLLQPTLCINFILAFWNKAATNQYLWQAFWSFPQFLFFLFNSCFLV